MFLFQSVPGYRQSDSSSRFAVSGRAPGRVYVAIATTIHASIVLLAMQLRPLLTAGRHQRVGSAVMSLALVMVAAWLAWSTRRI